MRTGSRIASALAIACGALLGATGAIAVPRGAPGKIAFRSDKTGYPNIYSMNADGSDVVDLTNQQNWNDQASWSPDGSKIVFTSQRDGRNQTYVMNADGSSQHNISNSSYDDEVPDWSPDGTRIAFRRDVPDGNATDNEIWVMNADGSDQQKISGSDTLDISPSWSPDGTKIAYSGNGDIWTMNPDGSDKTNLTNDPRVNYEPSWGGPDGHEIAFTSTRKGIPTIWVIHDDGTGLKQLTTTTGLESSWAPDGSKLLYTGAPDGKSQDYDIWVMNADGSDQTDLTPTDTALNAEASWQPVTASPPATTTTTTSTTTTAPNAPSPQPRPARCDVPDLRGLTIARARRVLVLAHCRLGRVTRVTRVIRRHRHSHRALVRSQSPAAGRSRPAGTKVAVSVS